MNKELIRSKLQSIIEKTNPTRNNAWTLWTNTMTVLLGVTAVAGGVATSVFSLGIGAPIGGAATAAGTALIWSVANEAKNAYTKDEWLNGGKINYINFLINGQATQMLSILDVANDDDLKRYSTTILAFEDYLVDKFNGIRFLGKEINEVITQDNIMNSYFVADYAITERLFFRDNMLSDSEEVLRKTIVESIGSNDFKRIFGVNERIRYIIENGFSLSDIGVFIAKGSGNIPGVEDLITSLEDIQITLNSSDGNKLFTTYEKIEDGLRLAKISQNYYPGQTGVDINAVPAGTIQKLNLDTINFPSDAYGLDGQPGANQEALDILKSFDGFGENGDITTYKFKFYKSLTTTSVSPVLIINLWNSIFSSDKVSPQEMFSNQIKNRYMEFILKVIEDYQDDGAIDQTLTSTRNEVFSLEFKKLIYSIIAIDKEISRRVKIFQDLEKIIDIEGRDSGNPINISDLRKIEAGGSQAFIDTEVSQAKKPLTEEQIKDRQRFYKQCALMLNIHRLSPKFEDIILDRQTVYEKFDGPNKKKPFGGRFWRAQSDNTEQLMTNLVSSEDSSYMFEIPSHIMTQLTPKFRLYKVMNEKSGKLKQTEFVFPMYTDINRSKNFKKQQNTTQEGVIPSFLSAQFDKGDGVGLKSFSLEFNGTNPAEARNDVKGQMSLMFQSFADFTRARIDPNGNEYRFVDLIIQPKPDEDNRVAGIKVTSLRQYEPTFYRIRVDMGYNIPDKLEGINEKDLGRLKNALRSMNKSFYLCMIDHSFNINNDGTVEMNFTYRAYLETALKSLRFDALTTPELAKKRLENETKLHDVAMADKCTKDELRELQLAIAGVEQELILNSLNSIMTRLHKRNKIFRVTIDNDDRKYFLNNGFYRTCDLLNDVDLDESPDSSTGGDLGVVLNSNFLSEDVDVNFQRDLNDTNVQFFFFGDLLHTILDALYDPDTKGVSVGLENTKIILGHFEFDPYQGHGSSGKYNISNIPISVDFFGEWFKQNVLNQKSTRRTFPILNFIRNLSNYLVNNALLETCVNRNVDKAIRFQTGQISALSSDGIDPIGKYTNVNKNFSVIRTDSLRKFKKLPLKGDVEGSSNIEDFYHYIVLSCNGSALTYSGSGNYKKDIEAGRFHVEIGSNRGIVKTVQFSKTDMQYLREARFFRNGVDGLLQLSSVYTANIEMFGNTLFYPGMDLWINPYGFGGTHLGNPNQGGGETGAYSNRSLANILGIGGYHTITGVTINLTPQKFSTTVKSQHYYSGDGENPDANTLKAVSKSKEGDLIEMGVADHANDKDAAYCRDVILEELNFDVTAQTETIENIEDDPGGSQQPAPIAEPTINEVLGESNPEDEFDLGESDNG